jgi:transcriptional antiterminator
MTAGGKLRVERVIGNNVILVVNEATLKEAMLLGKGLGFSLKPGDLLAADDSRIEKKFRLDNQEQMKLYHSLTEQIEPEVQDVTERIFGFIASDITEEFSVDGLLALPSHLQFALYRLRNNMEIVNPFVSETRILFPKEYEVATKAAALMEHVFHVRIPEDEIGFITYHVLAATNHVPVKTLVQLSTLVTELVELVEAEKGITIPRDSIDYIRLITHLRFAIERIKQRVTEKNPFIHGMKKLYKAEYALASKLGQVMGQQLNMPVPEDEIGFMAMHLYRLFQHYPSP